jgi:nitrite reductase/ring-hydroxylating ferredoxin subunit
MSDDDEWTAVMASEDLREARPTRRDVDGAAVMLYRTRDRLFAVGSRCSHQGAPLDRGVVRVGGSEASVTCPAHGSVFRLSDGAVLRAPAQDPIPAFEVRIVEGTIELRARPQGS